MFLLQEDSVTQEIFEIGSGIIHWALAIIAIWCFYCIIARMFGLSKPRQADPPADYAGSPSRRKPRPKTGTGSIAIAEPDNDE